MIFNTTKQFSRVYDNAYDRAWAKRDPRDSYAEQARKAHDEAVKVARSATKASGDTV